MRFPVGSPHRCDGGCCGQGFPGHNYARIRLANPGLVGRGQPFLPEKSHVISLGQFSICPENVGIATIRFQSLNNVFGNYVRHLWGTMRVPLLPRPRRGFADGEDLAEGLVLLRLRRGCR